MHYLNGVPPNHITSDCLLPRVTGFTLCLINDAKNTIIQMKYYLYCIYEILLRILDNLTKLTIDTGEGLDNEHFYHIIVLVELLVKEINTIVNNSI